MSSSGAKTTALEKCQKLKSKLDLRKGEKNTLTPSYLVIDPLQMLARGIGHERADESGNSPLDQVRLGQQGCC